MTTNTDAVLIGRDTKDKLLAMIERNIIEPVSANEIFLAQRKGLRKAYSTVSRALVELVAEGSLIARPELPSERVPNRRRGNAPMMFWPTSKGKTVPVRKTDMQFPGVHRAATTGIATRSRTKPKFRRRPAIDSSVQTGRADTVTRRPAIDLSMQTGNRIERLEKRVAELESVIARLGKILN